VERQRKATVDLDAWLLHPVAGYFIFLLVMGGLFCFLFYVSAPFMDAIDASFSLLGRVVAPWLPNSLQNFVVNGLLSGVAGVMVFVPQIAMLFFGLGIMESSGFLARSAVLIDHPFRKVGLNGRSFVPLLSGCACAVPAILATRVIPNQRVRRLTMAIIPLMQCSARLPVYGLLLSTLFTSSLAKAMALTGIYVISIFISAVVLAVANRWVPSSRNADAPFIIELPKWRWPDFQGLVRDTFRKTSKFLVGAGPIILGISLGLWGMAEIQINNQPLIYILGHFISPIVQPMGVDWRVGVAILLSFAAREVFVSALAIVHHMSSQSLADSVASTHGLFTPASAVGLVLFFMVAMQCGATVVVLKNEMKSLRWPILILVAYICLAYALAVLANMVL
jgi:ferrous iron transport protein B